MVVREHVLDAGVVHHEVEPAVRVLRGRGELLRRAGLRQVDRDFADVHARRATFLGHRLEIVIRMGAQRKATAPLGEGAGNVGAEAAGGACEQGECPVQFEHPESYRRVRGDASGGDVDADVGARATGAPKRVDCFGTLLDLPSA